MWMCWNNNTCECFDNNNDNEKNDMDMNNYDTRKQISKFSFCLFKRF